jgi:hypothetical protein
MPDHKAGPACGKHPAPDAPAKSPRSGTLGEGTRAVGLKKRPSATVCAATEDLTTKEGAFLNG